MIAIARRRNCIPRAVAPAVAQDARSRPLSTQTPRRSCCSIDARRHCCQELHDIALARSSTTRQVPYRCDTSVRSRTNNVIGLIKQHGRRQRRPSRSASRHPGGPQARAERARQPEGTSSTSVTERAIEHYTDRHTGRRSSKRHTTRGDDSRCMLTDGLCDLV